MDALQYLSDVSDAESFDSPRSYKSRSRKRNKHKHSSSKRIKSENVDSESDTNHSHRSKITNLYNDEYREGHAERHHKRRHKRRKASVSPVSDLDYNHTTRKEHLGNEVREDGEFRDHHSRSRSHKRHKSHHKRSKSRHRHRDRDGSVEHSRKSKKRHRRRSESSSSSSSSGERKVSVKQERESPSVNGVSVDARVPPDPSRWDSVNSSRASSRRPAADGETRVKRELSGSEEDEQRLGSRQRDASSQNGAGHQNGREEWGRPQEMKKEAEAEPEEKVKPNLGLSGKLTEDANTYKGVVIKYSQPAEARKPKRRWRWYIFKGEEELPYLPLHRQSAYLIGRERRVVDVPTDHPSCSKQHAVLQYRLVRYTREDNTTGRTVKPYIIDLDSANGTYVNNRRITPRSYVELMEKDVVKFGYSSREYVLLHETSKDSDVDTADGGLDTSPVSALMSIAASTSL